jgi:DNA-binding transcriptional ArsR family regulator
MKPPTIGARALAATACLLGDESRAAMCLALLDGSAWTVSELAEAAAVGKPAASEHVARLEAGRLVRTETQGRHKFVRLAGPEVAEIMEQLSRFGEADRPGSLRAVRERDRLAAARTCYDHLAGRLGVAVHDALLDARVLRRRGGLGLTGSGREWFADLGVDVAMLEQQRRVLVRDCVDLTERTPHLAGGLGAALCATFVGRDWVRRPDRTRALVVTPLGERALGDLLAIAPADLQVR